MKHPIPDAALDDRLFFTGIAGTGKTYNAMGRVERLLKRKNRVIISDPLGVWWGLRLDSDGKRPSGYDVVIFGGPHGDLPLTEHTGTLIGETVAGMAESCILDLSGLEKAAAERRFMLAFLTAVYRRTMGDPVHVVFDEADMWSPQRVLDKEGDANKLLGMMETIVRRGRVKGFIPWLISQRPAVINKNVLSQVDGLVAFGLTSSQDRDAIGDWVEGQADKAQWKEIWSSLPTMERGQGVVWIPRRSILDTVQFPPKETFDSSRTPKRGERTTHAELKPLDIDKLKDRLAKVDAEQKASDPRALRAEINRLTHELNKKLNGQPAADKAEIEAAELHGFERGKKEVAAAADRRIKEVRAEFIAEVDTAIKPLTEVLKSQAAAVRADKSKIAAQVTFTPSASPVPTAGHAAPRPVLASVPRAKPSAVASGDGSYTRPQMRVLQSLAMWKALRHDAPSREMVAAVAGYSPSSGGFNNLLGSLGPKATGVIGIPMPGRVSLEVDGIGVISQDEGRELLLSTLTNPQKKIVGALIDQGTRTREDVGAATEYSPSSGGFNNLLGSLGTLGIVVKPQQGSVALSDWAQELLAGHAERLAA